ncbi:MAG: hypothetical protein INQ03_20320 [Candidatus Heimdallarchaeota archaeon]|nr:hypothetical protein [Candidatus Heimdallarchaeota archaeon]
MKYTDIEKILLKAEKFEDIGSIDEALNTLQELKTITQQRDEMEYQCVTGDIYFKIGNIYLKMENYDTALINFDMALTFISKTYDYRTMALIQIHIGICKSNLEYYGDRNEKYKVLGNYFFQLGISYESVHYLSLSLQFFSMAEKMYIVAENELKMAELAKKNRDIQLMYFKDLSQASNLYNYSNDNNQAYAYAWRALTVALELIEYVTSKQLTDKQYLNHILENIHYAKRALLSENNEMTSVKALKIREFISMINDLKAGNIDEDAIMQTLDIHRTSIRYLLPMTPPSFIFSTTDGRLFHYNEIGLSQNTESIKSDSILFAGILSAVKIAFQEKVSPIKGLINEIKIDGNSVIMENSSEYNFFIVSVTTFIYPELRQFVKDLNKELGNQFGQLISEWKGNADQLIQVKEYIDTKITTEFFFE